jgi:hypothetical protein
LLVNSGEAGPFVLVGHSKAIAHSSTGSTALLSAIVQAMKPSPKTGGFEFFGLMRALRPFGVPRLFTDTFLQGSPYAYVRPEVQPAFRFGMNQPARIATSIAETEHRQANVDQVRAVGSLGSVPRNRVNPSIERPTHNGIIGASNPSAYHLHLRKSHSSRDAV